MAQISDDRLGHDEGDAPPAVGPVSLDQYLQTIEDPKITELISVLEQPERYDFASLFPKTRGMGARSDVKRRLRMLRSVEPRLDLLLYPDERIEYVGFGTLNSIVEQYFMGLWSVIINRTVFLFTNYRVILLNSNGKGVVKAMSWQIPYERIKKYGGLFGGAVKFKLDNNKVYRFVGVRKQDRKALKTFIREHIEGRSGSGWDFPSHQARDPLCPVCATPVPQNVKSCEACDEAFVNPQTPSLLSLVIPGLGDLYLGHRTMAIVEFGGTIFLWLVVGGILLNDQEPLRERLLIGSVVLAIGHGFDALMTFAVANKGVLSKRQTWGRKIQTED